MKMDLIFEEKGPSKEFAQTLEDFLRSGAQTLLQKAIEQAVEEFLESFAESKTRNGRKGVLFETGTFLKGPFKQA